MYVIEDGVLRTLHREAGGREDGVEFYFDHVSGRHAPAFGDGVDECFVEVEDECFLW